MSQHKFFSGLTPKMENRTRHGPNRQQTQFYWPEDANKQAPANRRMSRSSSKDSGGTNWDASNYDTDQANRAIRERKNKQLQSRIEFYDVVDEVPAKKSVDVNQNEISKKKVVHSDDEGKNDVNKERNGEKNHVNGDSANKKVEETQNNHKSIENLEERIHEIHLDDSPRAPPSKRPDNDSYDSDEEYQRERRRMKKIPSRSSKRQDSWEEYENREIRRPPPSRRPPRSNYEYEEEYYPPNRAISRERYRYDDYDSRPIARPPPSPRRYVDEYPAAEDRYYDAPPTPRRYLMDPDYEPIDRDFYYEEPPKEALPPTPPRQRIIPNGTTSPVKRPLVKRAMSVCSDCPSEISRAMSQRHLKSNIFFTDKEAIATNPRPRTVRDSAVNRVCVGLPDLE